MTSIPQLTSHATRRTSVASSQPANESMPPIYVDAKDVEIQGIVVGVMRKY